MGMTNEAVIAILSELKKCYLGGIVDALDFAIEAVKAQEARVMTLEEVQSCENAMWIELLGGKLGGKGFYAFVLDRMKNGILEISTRAAYLRYYSKDYNVKWRCWTGCPTQE